MCSEIFFVGLGLRDAQKFPEKCQEGIHMWNTSHNKAWPGWLWTPVGWSRLGDRGRKSNSMHVRMRTGWGQGLGSWSRCRGWKKVSPDRL